MPVERILPSDAGSRAALAGVMFGFLYIVTFLLLRRLPAAGASLQEAEAFYSSSGERRILVFVGVYLVPIAGIMLLWFTAAVRHRVANLVAREDALLSTVQLLSAAVYVAMLFAAAAVLTAPAIAVDVGATSAEDAADDRSMLVVGNTILVVFALRSAGVFIAAGTTRALRSGLIPRWFAVVSYVLVVVLLFTIARARALSLLFPIWVMVMSLIVLKRRVSAEASTSEA